MAISANTVWQIYGTGASGGAGSDNNGGSYITGSTGTDYSRQASAQATATDGVSTGTAAFTSASALFTSAMVGNGINIAGSYYQVATYVSATSITTDRATTTGTGITWAVGGALANVATALSNMVAINTISAVGGFAMAAQLTLAAAVATPSAATPGNRFIGSAVTPGDGGQAVFTQSTGGTYGLSCNVSGWQITGYTFNGNNNTGAVGITVGTSGSYIDIYNCRIKNFYTYGIVSTGKPSVIQGCEFTGATTSTAVAINDTGGYGTIIFGNNVHDCTCAGIIISASTANAPNISFNIITNMTGSSSDAISAVSGTVSNNTIHGPGRDGIRVNSTATSTLLIKGNILTGCGTTTTGYGLNFASAGNVPYGFFYDGNFYGSGTGYANTSGNIHNVNNTSTYGMPYTNSLDVTNGGNPYVNAGSNNWNLASGSLAIGTAPGNSYPGNSYPGALSFGALQPAASASTSIIVNQNMIGANE